VTTVDRLATTELSARVTSHIDEARRKKPVLRTRERPIRAPRGLTNCELNLTKVLPSRLRVLLVTTHGHFVVTPPKQRHTANCGKSLK
jgi:hypothetical protein